MFARRAVYLRGTHWFVAYPGRWRLELADGLAVRDTDSGRRLDMAVARLCGELLDAVAIHLPTSRTEMFFDLGGHVTVRWPRGWKRDSGGELWSLHNTSRFVALLPGGLYDTGTLKQSGENPVPLNGSGWLVVARSKRRERELRSHLLGEAV
jgi:hypothetical protein